MAKKANIQKIREDMLIEGGTKKTILPITIDKAVQVKKENKYEGLDKSLSRKWERCLTYTVSTTNGDIEGKVHYIFAFNSVKNLNRFKQLMFETASTPSSNATFIKKLRDTYGELSAEDEDLIYEILNSQSYTEENLLYRVQVSHLKNTFIDYTRLHDSFLNSYVVVDENNHSYAPGDTIEFTSYPGILYVKTSFISHDYLESLTSAIMNIDNAGSRVKYNWIFKSPIEGLDNVSLSVKVTEPVSPAGNSLISSELRPYQIPLNYYSDYLRDTDYEYNISVINTTIETLYNNYIKVYIYPTDHPVIHGYVDEQVIYNYESSGVKKGILSIEDSFTLDDVELEIADRLGLNRYNIVFNVQTTPPIDPDDPDPAEPEPDEPKFAFESPNKGVDITLNRDNSWLNGVYVKGINVANNSTTTLSFADPDCDFELYVKNDPTVIPGNSVSLTKADVRDGKTINIKPKNWTSRKDYVPYQEAGTYNNRLNLVYNLQDGVDVVDHAETFVNVKCVVNANDIPIVEPVIVPDLKPFDVSDRMVEVEITVTGITDSGFFDISGYDAYYYRASISNNTNDTVVTVEPFTISNSYYSTTYDENAGEYTNYNYFDWTQTFTRTQVEDGVSFKLQIPARDNNGNIIRGNGEVILYANWNNSGLHGKDAGKEIHCSFNVDYISLSPEAIDAAERYQSIHGANYVVAEDSPQYVGWVDDIYHGSTFGPVPIQPNNSEPQEQEEEAPTTDTHGFSTHGKEMQNNSNAMSQLEADSITGLQSGAFLGKNYDQQMVETTLESLRNVDTIPDYCFANNETLEKVVIPENIKHIGVCAFANCPNLTSITFSNSVEDIGSGVCMNCTSLETVDFGENISRIPIGGFLGCPNLTEIYLRMPYTEDDGPRTYSFIGRSVPAAFDAALDYSSDVSIYARFGEGITYETFANGLAAGTSIVFFPNHFDNATVVDLDGVSLDDK